MSKMESINFLRLGKWVIIVLQCVAIAIPFLFLLLSFSMNDEGVYDTPLGFSNVSLVPEDSDLLQKMENVSVRYLKDERASTELMIEKTKIYLRDGMASIRTEIFLIFLVFCLLSALGLEIVKRIIKVTEVGTPFNYFTVRNIYLLSILFFLTPIVVSIYHYFFGQWILSNFELTGLVLKRQSISYVPWVTTGIVLFTIGKVIRQGVQLKEEQDLTV